MGSVGAPDPLEVPAKRLVWAARSLATSSFTQVASRFPFVAEYKPHDWDFFVAAGGVSVALNALLKRVQPDRFKSVYAVIVPDLHQWDPQSEYAIVDCQRFVRRTLNEVTSQPTSAELPRYLAVDSLGIWVLWNLMRREPTDKEAQAARSVGGLLAQSFDSWWDDSFTPT
jgi:hypothetical protein